MKKRYTMPRIGLTVADNEPLAGDSYTQGTDVPGGGGGTIGARRWHDDRQTEGDDEDVETADTMMVMRIRRSLWE